jgi:hypothetical protein
VFDRVVADVKEKLNQSALNRAWTSRLKSVFGDIAEDVDRSYVLSSSAHGGEHLFDLAWRRSASCPDIVLAMESEWGDEGDVLNDFVKLMNVKANLKVMIFTTKSDVAARSKMQAAIEKCLGSSLHHINGEEYLLFNFPSGLPGMAYLLSYTVQRDGKQIDIRFEERRQTKLWD